MRRRRRGGGRRGDGARGRRAWRAPRSVAPAPVAQQTLIGRSAQGRPIGVTRIADAGERVRRRVLVVGCVHGDECAGRAIVDAAARAGARRASCRRTPSCCSSATSTPTAPRSAAGRTRAGWTSTATARSGGGTSGRRGSRFYAGPRAWSEPESRAIRALILGVRPDVVVWYHQPLDARSTCRRPAGTARAPLRAAGRPAACARCPPTRGRCRAGSTSACGRAARSSSSSTRAARSAPSADRHAHAVLALASLRSGAAGRSLRIVARASRADPRRATRRRARSARGQRARSAPRSRRAAARGRGGRQRARGGTVVRTSATQSSSGSSPEISRASPLVTGASTPARASARASSGTRSSDSTAWPIRSGISADGTPCASSSPARRLRLPGGERGRDEVAGAREPDHRLRARALRLGVAPDLGEDVAGRAAGGVQALALGRAARERRGVLRRARELDADRVAGLLADDARAVEGQRDRVREVLALGRGDEPGALVTISRACAGPPMTAMRCGPEEPAQVPRRRLAVRRDEALGQRDHGRARTEPARRAARRSPRRGRARGRRGRRGRTSRARRSPARSAGPAGARRRAGTRGSRRAARRRSACSSVRVCSVVRRPPRASRTATAVPNEPAPTTTARRAPGRANAGRGRSATRATTRPPSRGF